MFDLVMSAMVLREVKKKEGALHKRTPSSFEI
jgi:hypothetical protein